MFGNHGLCGLPEEGAHEKSPKCLDGNLGDLGGGFCKGLCLCLGLFQFQTVDRETPNMAAVCLGRIIAVCMVLTSFLSDCSMGGSLQYGMGVNARRKRLNPLADFGV